MPARVFDSYLRSITAAVIALAVVGAAIWSLATQATTDVALVGWAGIVVGFYFGSHATLNGSNSRRRAADFEPDKGDAPDAVR